MKVLLINPKFPPSFWSYAGAVRVTQRPGLITPLGLATLAALTPDDVDLQIVDESVETVDLDADVDLVGITGYITQRGRMFELAASFRARGVPVAIGGPYASLSSSTVRPHADILFIGEAEQTWPRFIDEFRTGTYQDEYRQTGTLDITESPLPRVDGLHNDRYYMGAVQTSRGCPFECEFCDVITLLGRRQRYKDPAHIIRELETMRDVGHRFVFLVDDNLTAHRRRSAEIMGAIAEWNNAQPERLSFNTQMSIDIARESDEGLLDTCVEAGLSFAFVGIETPSSEALLEVNKHQNVRYDLLTNVRRLYEHGIMIQAGMIVGFDADTTDIFERQYDFAQEAGTAMTSLTILNAPEGTPLEARLKAAGRLQDQVDDVYLVSNIVPLHMSQDELSGGTRWLMNRLYDPANFFDRLAVLASQLPFTAGRTPAGRSGAALWDRLQRDYCSLGDDFADIPKRGAQCFRGKNLSQLGTTLIFYLHVVRLLRYWGIWDPDLARQPEPVW